MAYVSDIVYAPCLLIGFGVLSVFGWILSKFDGIWFDLLREWQAVRGLNQSQLRGYTFAFGSGLSRWWISAFTWVFYFALFSIVLRRLRRKSSQPL